MHWYLIVTFLGSLASLAIFLLFLARGHFTNLEDVKYQMFWEDEHYP